MKTIGNIIKGLLISVWVVMAIVTTILLISYNDYSVSEIGKNSIFIVDDERMEPLFNKNDIIITTSMSEEKYKEGDKVFFYLQNARDKVFINMGEITKVERANHAEDSFFFDDVQIGASDLLGPVNGTRVLHKWGLLLNIFESRWGFMFLIILPTIFAIVYEIYSIIEEVKYAREEE